MKYKASARVIFWLMTSLFSAASSAAHLNGNLDYSVSDKGGTVFMTLINRIPGNPIYLQTLSLVEAHGKEIPVYISPGKLIASSITVKLGTMAGFIQQHPLKKGSQPIRKVSVSDKICQPALDHCSSSPVVVNIKTYVPTGMPSKGLMQVYLHYY